MALELTPRLSDRVVPVLAVLAGIGIVWYLAAVWLNAPQVIERVFADKPGWSWRELVGETWSMERPVLPAPHQIAIDMFHSIFGWPPDSPPDSPLRLSGGPSRARLSQ